MTTWTTDTARTAVHDFDTLSPADQSAFLAVLNDRFPPATYERHKNRLQQAKKNTAASREILAGARQSYPVSIDAADCAGTVADLTGFAIVLTAGGEGERLRLSLLERGVPAEELADFTKATFPLPGLSKNAGALQINLALIAQIEKSHGISLPVVVTTGPAQSDTDRIIPEILRKNNFFGLADCMVIRQDERLHLSSEEKIVPSQRDGKLFPAVNPDETGGPVMKLRESYEGGASIIDRLKAKGCTRIMLLQGTAVYAPAMLFAIAAAGRRFDGLGVGIRRESFPEKDPYGTYVVVDKDESKKLVIVEQDVRTEATRTVTDPSGKHYLPFNTGFYAFDIDLIAGTGLPDYCTPPKEIRPDLERAPKAGYAATEVIGLAVHPGVLTVDPASFGVIKNADDLAILAALARKLGLDKLV